MTLAELKNAITDPENNDPIQGFIILKCEDNHFLVDQYLKALENDSPYEINKITSIKEPSTSALSLVFDYENRINVLKVETFDEYVENYDELGNIIVVCDKIDKKVEEVVAPYVIKIPKLQPWHIADYVKVNTSLDNEMIERLIQGSKGDIYKVTNEIEKLKMFTPEEQPKIFAEMINDPETDLYDQSLMDIASAMVKGDRLTVLNGLLHRKLLDMDPMWLISLLIGNYKKILFINFKSGLSLEDMKITAKQEKAIKYYYKHVSLDKVKHALRVLTSIDTRLKTGELLIDPPALFDYIMCQVIM